MNINSVLVQLPPQLRGVAPQNLRAHISVASPKSKSAEPKTPTSPVDVVDFSPEAQALLASQQTQGSTQASNIRPTTGPKPPPQRKAEQSAESISFDSTSSAAELTEEEQVQLDELNAGDQEVRAQRLGRAPEGGSYSLSSLLDANQVGDVVFKADPASSKPEFSKTQTQDPPKLNAPGAAFNKSLYQQTEFARLAQRPALLDVLA